MSVVFFSSFDHQIKSQCLKLTRFDKIKHICVPFFLCEWITSQYRLVTVKVVTQTLLSHTLFVNFPFLCK